MIQYIINASVIWLASLLVFDVLLKREAYHGYNRFYLLFTFSMGAVLPLWDLLLSQPGRVPDTLIMSHPQLLQWLVVIYLSGAAVAFGLLVFDILKLVALYRRGVRTREDGWTVVATGHEHPPFSYLDILFVENKDRYSETEWQLVLAHERQHSVLLHLVDMALMQLTRIVLWFHPLVYLFHSRLLLVHEYQADRASATEPQEYGRFLLEQAMLQPAPSLSHSFNRSPIKNRIVMLAKNLVPRTGTSNLKLLLIVPLTFVCLFVFINTGYPFKMTKGDVWKKQVTRMIDIGSQGDTVAHHIRDNSPDTTLLEMLVNAVDGGGLQAYSNFDAHFSYTLSKEDLRRMIRPAPDTIIVVDPITGAEQTKVVVHDFDYSRVHKYRVAEEWTYDQRTHKTEITILGLAPIEDVYGQDGSFRGVHALFWVKYNEIQKIMDRYELFHPTNTINELLWKDNFNPANMSPTHP